MSLHFPDKGPELGAVDLLDQLRVVADAGDEAAFVAMEAEICWQDRPAVDFVQAIRYALVAGAYCSARTLAGRGAALHPNHSELREYARVLAPPQVSTAPLPPDPSTKANRDWLMEFGGNYRGQWVALRSGRLVNAASSFGKLTAGIDNKTGILLTKVF